ncbi:flavin reductase family protein [Algihabitans albus]|uniref:flavin reductase family protein n=1 Tax=Algihabitans albus TaxID=2164067 RepID=UPI000E5C6418|nr:flavin reductase family protein [Algihabitans albus]
MRDDLSRGSPTDTTTLRHALGWFATGVTIATTLDGEAQPVGLTCNSFNSVSLEPPLVLWSLGRKSFSRPAFEQATHFAINVLPADQTGLAKRFAKPLEDKWAGVDWTPGTAGIPRLPLALAVFDCQVRERFHGGDHLIFLGEIVDLQSREIGEPLIFLRGRFGGFAATED